MKWTTSIGGSMWEVDTRRGIDISIPMDFEGPQPGLYGVAPATAEPWTKDGFIGSVSAGGPCNVARVSFVPHCNGTHTESVGHITAAQIDLVDVLRPGLIPASVVSVTPERAGDGKDTSDPPLDPDDLIISATHIEHELEAAAHGFTEACIIRTLPNSRNRVMGPHASNGAPFLSIEAMQVLVDAGVRHLLVDLPSVDRLHDDGRMAAHKRYWERDGVSASNEASLRTITELIFVPDDVPDGPCILDLQAPAWRSDAAPSRPILYPVSR